MILSAWFPKFTDTEIPCSRLTKQRKGGATNTPPPPPSLACRVLGVSCTFTTARGGVSGVTTHESEVDLW